MTDIKSDPDILDDLYEYRNGLGVPDGSPLSVLLARAIEEITYLRELAGGVSRGPSFSDIKSQAANYKVKIQPAATKSE